MMNSLDAYSLNTRKFVIFRLKKTYEKCLNDPYSIFTMKPFASSLPRYILKRHISYCSLSFIDQKYNNYFNSNSENDKNKSLKNCSIVWL